MTTGIISNKQKIVSWILKGILGAFAALLLIALLYLIGIDLLKRIFRKEG